MPEHLSYAHDPELSPVTVDPAKAPEDATFELFRSGLGDAAVTIIRTARGENVGAMQFKAAVYVVERILGKPRETSSQMDDDLKRLLSDIKVSETEPA